MVEKIKMPDEFQDLADTVNEKQSTPSGLEPFDIYTIEPPTEEIALIPSELEKYNQDVQRSTPKWLDTFFTVKGKEKAEIKFHVRLDEVAFGDEFLSNNLIASFPALQQGAVYLPKLGIWRIFAKGEALQAIESRATDTLIKWNVYKQQWVVLIRQYIFRAMYDEKFGNVSPFDNSAPALVAFKNGTLNIETGKIQDHDPLNWLINGHDYNIDPSNDKAPETDKLLKAMFGSGDIFFKEFIGYSFYRSYAPFQTAVFLHGSGGQGKSTIINHILKNVIGSDNYSVIPPEDLSGKEAKFNKALLYGKEINSVADIDKGYLPNTSILKKLTGGDAINAEYKGINGFSFNNYAKLLFSANSLPTFSDNSDGFRDRLVTIDLINGDTRVDKKFWEHHDIKKVKEETPQFAMECIKLFKQALDRKSWTITPEIQAATDKWYNANDHIGVFLSEATKIDPTDQRGESAKVVLDEYKQWASDNGFSTNISMPTIESYLERLDVKKVRNRRGFTDSNRVYRFIGLKLTTSFLNPAFNNDS